MTLLAKSPEQRVQTAKELGQLLTELALAHGWISKGDLSQPSLSHVVVDAAACIAARRRAR